MGESIKKKYLPTEPSNLTSVAIKKKLKSALIEEKQKTLLSKPLHGQFYKHINQNKVDTKMTMKWLRSSGLKVETESLIIAAQDQALNTRYHQRAILKQNVDGKCRLCKEYDEHISHIVAGCSVLAPTEYLDRHNKVASYLHWTLLKELGHSVPEKWYEHKPDRSIEVDEVVIMYDMPVNTDRTVGANRPDIIIHNRKKHECLLVDVAVPADVNVSKKEVEKMSKYKDLEIEIARMWKTKTKVIPVVVGALGTTSTEFIKHLDRLPFKVCPDQIQKITLLGTAHILRKVLSIGQ